MTLRHMKIFVTVCRCKSATKAAERLGIAQPAVSLAIKELEQYYGVSLFDRISHRLYITDEGKRLFEYACKIVLLFDEAESDIRDWDSFGVLRIGSSLTIGTCLLPDYVVRFHSKYPKIKVLVTVDNSTAIEKKILENQLDFALIEGIVHSGSIVRYPFLKDELILVCGAKDNTIPDEVSIEQLGELPFLLREKGSGTRELFDSTLLTKGITITPEWESISTDAIVSAVSCGLGVSVLPLKLVEHDLAKKNLRRISIRGLTFERYFYLIHHKDKHLTKTILAFWELNGLNPSSNSNNKKIPQN